MADAPCGWRDTAKLAGAARFLLLVQAALCVAAIVLALQAGLVEAQLSAGRAALWLAQMIVYAAGAFSVLRWIYLAHRNVRFLGAQDMMVGPGWAVGWFFVPLANLVMPFVAMRELAKASRNPKDWQAESAPVTLAFWWGFWLAAGLAGAAAFRLDLEQGKETLEAVGAFQLASDLLTIPASLLLERIVAAIQASQAHWAPQAPEALRDRFA